jgi:hypothetical protein
MYYIIQENTFREENYDVLVDTINRYDLPYEIIKVLPFTDDIEFKTDRKDVFCFGSVKLSRVAKKQNWFPGSLFNENHDYRVYSEYYKDNLLNYDSTIQKFGDEINRTDIFFARPCEDTKTFTGKVFDQETWNKLKNDHLTGGYESTLTPDTKIQICSVKNITKEFRFWIIGGEVVTGSLYRMGDWKTYVGFVDDGALEFCKKMVDVYQLAEAFVMDICEVNGEYKIVECGCINCAGFYNANMPKLIEAIEFRWK